MGSQCPALLLKLLKVALLTFCIIFSVLQSGKCLKKYFKEIVVSSYDLPSITETVPVQFAICSSLSYKHNILANINSSYASYVREAEWFGNTTNMTAEQIFRIITFNSS